MVRLTDVYQDLTPINTPFFPYSFPRYIYVSCITVGFDINFLRYSNEPSVNDCPDWSGKIYTTDGSTFRKQPR